MYLTFWLSSNLVSKVVGGGVFSLNIKDGAKKKFYLPDVKKWKNCLVRSFLKNFPGVKISIYRKAKCFNKVYCTIFIILDPFIWVLAAPISLFAPTYFVSLSFQRSTASELIGYFCSYHSKGDY